MNFGALALGAFALVMSLPLAGSAGTLTSTFLSSTTGTSSIGAGDTITFEVGLGTVNGNSYDTMIFSLTGDAANGVSDSGPTWGNTDNLVTAWDWAYKSAGNNTVKFATNGVALPANNSTITSLPIPVSIGYGWFGAIVDGLPSFLGSILKAAATSSCGTYSA